jgi:hypothetical protein
MVQCCCRAPNIEIWPLGVPKIESRAKILDKKWSQIVPICYRFGVIPDLLIIWHWAKDNINIFLLINNYIK